MNSNSLQTEKHNMLVLRAKRNLKNKMKLKSLASYSSVNQDKMPKLTILPNYLRD